MLLIPTVLPWNEPLNDPDPIPVNEPVKDPVVLLTPIKEPLNVVAVTLEPLSTVIRLILALDTVNEFPVEETLADTVAVAICVKFNPTIPDAGMLVKPPPLP